jgi:hypothetical protein
VKRPSYRGISIVLISIVWRSPMTARRRTRIWGSRSVIRERGQVGRTDFFHWGGRIHSQESLCKEQEVALGRASLLREMRTKWAVGWRTWESLESVRIRMASLLGEYRERSLGPVPMRSQRDQGRMNGAAIHCGALKPVMGRVAFAHLRNRDFGGQWEIPSAKESGRLSQ